MNEDFNRSLRKDPPAKKLLKPLIILAILILIGVAVYSVYSRQNTSADSSNPQSGNDTQVKTQTVPINRDYNFPIEGVANLKPLKINLQNAQLTNRIVVGGEPRFAPKDGNFLMLYLLLQNENTQGINFRSRDIIRFIDPNNKKFAPSYFNSNVTVDPDAVKKDTVGFLVPNNQKKFSIQYGSLTGEKQTLELNFK
jgi:hypothetical protein